MKRIALIAAAATAGALAASAGEMVAYTDLDADDDGAVTEAEYVAYKTAKSDKTEAEAAEAFAKVDTDSDGIVTEAEFDTAVEAWKKKHDMDVGVDVETST